MKIKPKIIYLSVIILLVLISGAFIINKYVIEKYRKLRNVGLFPLKFNKVVNGSTFRDFDDDDNDKKYDRHHYSTYRRRYNFLAQRNSGQRQ